MAFTQDSIVSLLVAEGGKVKKSELMGKFRAVVDSVDPAERERNRELFKTFVNNVAFVKEVDGFRYVVLKKTYQHLLGGEQTADVEKTENEEEVGEQQRPPERHAEAEKSEDAAGSVKGAHEAVKEEVNDPGKSPSLIQLALQRMPPSVTRVEIHKLKEQPKEPPEVSKSEAFKNKRRPSSAETGRVVKKSPEEPKYIRSSCVYSLEQAEHEWLVKCAAGLWNQVYGLLLSDCHLVQKKDFMSGFTVLHWVAKCGNSQMLTRIIDTSRQKGVNVDVNPKSHGGYTPLHIAALHDQECIMTMLVAEYRANTSIRDNCGKKAYHYLPKGISPIVKEMMGEPKVQHVHPSQDRVVLHKEELDTISDASKGLHSISRLFPPTIMGNKKRKSGLYSLNEGSEEQEHSSFRHRTVSDASTC
uniref:SOWAHA-C winged helix-turn-helix domain-containing protein n=1 Tax=Nothobranchius furzeri TaxID=105023 RepID=A0A8C6LFB7_NOTFU